MKQLLQNYKSGKMSIQEIPEPHLSINQVLVQNHFSLISSGTEKGTVKTAQSSLVGKAKQRPDLVKQVVTQIKKNGLKETLDLIKNRLDSYVTLGYSCAGEVVASLDSENEFKPGDRVACAGQNYASHAEIVSIPQNLAVKIPDNVTYEEAAFTTLGAIALQGVRQADPKLGDNVCVIGLGLLGQITVQLLKSNGCNVCGTDLSPDNVQLAETLGADLVLIRSENDFISKLMSFTKGFGFDSVIITAATQSNDPIELSAEILRKKGSVVVVGAVKLDIPRDPHFYRKELELKLSCSYGPGRYDTNYEEKGIDYPIGYVRWTEKRNMDSFLNLLEKKLVDVKPLISHTFDIDEAVKAYDIILGKAEEKFIGILLKYSQQNKGQKTLFLNKEQSLKDVNIGFVGAGNFAQSMLIPNLINENCSLDTVVTSKGPTSLNAAQKFKFKNYSSVADNVFINNEINTVFIASRHNSHSKYVIEALKSSKHVFVEKPLAMSIEELQEISSVVKDNPDLKLMVGFNRRFAPISVKIKEELKKRTEPLVLNIRVNAGNIPKDHWIQDPEIGGGRIVGEVCHFIDLMQFFTDAEPVKVFASGISSKNNLIKNDDNISIIIEFNDGSIGNLVYTAIGDKALPKEYIEIFNSGSVYIINDFADGKFYINNKLEKSKLKGKGHKEEVHEFVKALRDGKENPISFNSIYLTTLTTFKILDSLSTGLPQLISE